jgi:hypothetical protein
MKKILLILLTIGLFTGFSNHPVTTCWSLDTPDAPSLSIGMNLSTLTYWTRELPFVDVFKQAMPWVTQNATPVSHGKNPWDTGLHASIPMDPEGYPLHLPIRVPGVEGPQIVATLMCRDTDGHYPAGRYVCLYEGDGDLAFGFDAKTIGRTRGRQELLVLPSESGILLKVKRSERSNPIRNIRVIMPGHEPTYAKQPFNPLFIERLKPFKVIRFMDWQRTNNAGAERWADRTKPASYTQAGVSGVAIEHMIALVNTLGADPWFCIPHGAEKHYVTQFARLVENKLAPERRVYVEYSNEVWNASFQQYHWVKKQGDPSLSHPQKYAERAKRVFDIWEAVFGHQRGRVIRVVSGQLANPWIMEQVMATLGPQGADAMALAAYFGLSDADHAVLKTHGEKATAELVLQLARGAINRDTLPWFRKHAALARSYGLDLITYEGGQHLLPQPSGTHPPYIQALWDSQTTPEMYGVYWELLRELKRLGTKLFLAYSFVSRRDSPWGSWGHLESLDQFPFEAPKYRALVDFSHASTAP